MNHRYVFGIAISLLLLFAFGSVVAAQTYTPNVQVSDRGIVDGAALMVRATAAGPAWVVVHADDGGKPGPVIGYAPIVEGDNMDVVVEVDEDAVTPILHAMLHEDSGAVGIYEFPGPDAPLKIGDNIVMAKFSAAPPLLPTSGGTGSPIWTLGIVVMVFGALAGSVLMSRRYA